MTKKILFFPVSALFLMTSLLPISCYAETSAPAEPAASASPAAEVEPPPETLIADFEGADLYNSLQGESGSWNLDMLDENNSYTDADIVELPGKDPAKPNQALKLAYSVESDVPSQNGFWTKLKSFDASHYDHLEFDVKGDAQKGFTSLFKIEIKKYKSSERVEKIKGSYIVKGITDQWQTISIPLNLLTGLMDFGDPAAWANPAIGRKDLDELVIVFQDRMVDKKTGAIYLDNIKFIRNGKPGPTAVDFPPRKKEKTAVRIEGLEFTKFLAGRLKGFPKQVLVKKEFPKDDHDFLMEVARDTWRFFDEVVDKEHALPLDNILIGKNEALDEHTQIGDYTNVTNIGVYLMCLVSGYDLGFITKEDAVERIRHTMNTLETIEYHKSGFPYNYYDTTTAERTSYFVSLVDSGWLVAGLYVVKNAFPEELHEQAERLINRGNFNFFYDPVDRQMFHGYYEHLEVYSDYHYGVFYTEPRASSYIAIAQGQVPEDHWYMGMIRTFPAEYTWQSQEPINRVKKRVGPYEFYGGYYEWKGIKYIPSWGGSGFEALMPTMVLKEKELAPRGLGLNDKRQVEGQIKYTLEELKFPVWGMSPSSVPEGGYSEYGSKPFGSKGYKPGVVTPHASILGIEQAPQAVIANMRKLIELYDIYGEYGFYDAVTVEADPKNPASKVGNVARKYFSLDQGMLFVALNNYLNDGAIRKRFHADPVMAKAEHLLSDEDFFEEAKAPAPAEPAEAKSPEAAEPFSSPV